MKTTKSFVAVSALLLAVLALPALGQSSYQGLPLLKANSSKVNVRVGDIFVQGFWTIKPEYNPNALHIQVTGQQERLVFYTDVDSAVYTIQPSQARQFYVLLNSRHYVLTEVKGFTFDGSPKPQQQDRFLNIHKPKSKTFGTLWEKHQVGEVVNDINEYADKVSGGLNWFKQKVFN
ncbi:hypothetical protein [Pontibacter anaerobius]|uniref:DUF4468 domain-containing protein n=1 Tax=Pontibacter anaerobius TaxID=2993940 RepID=A0ABT3RDI4_9BACT|nr:hypothetical protein [Pontibacter anaerobius]MCX2739483.1 hypothetical protein [Pontibacter anaerobius]